MLIDQRHVEQISIIVQVGTLQRTADKIGKSQPALSRIIRALETRIGQLLFELDRRPLQPTWLGLELASQGRAILVARQRAVESVDQSQRGVLGVLKIGVPPFICGRLVAEAISGYFCGLTSKSGWSVSALFPRTALVSVSPTRDPASAVHRFRARSCRGSRCRFQVAPWRLSCVRSVRRFW